MREVRDHSHRDLAAVMYVIREEQAARQRQAQLNKGKGGRR
jgi:phage FluMu protein gp41